MKLRFDNGPCDQPCLFETPSRLIVAHEPHEVASALVALDEARAGGAWVAGFASYELGYALEPRLANLMPRDRRLPLLQFGVFEAPRMPAPLSEGGFQMQGLRPLWSSAQYRAKFQKLHEYICAGDTYQVNLTFPMNAQVTPKVSGTCEALYTALVQTQPVRHGVLLEAEGLPTILSRSPELFFRTSATGQIETRPMKGTQPRSQDPVVDAQRVQFLRSDEKNQAENLMIVDLLRNDISRICEAGSVCVPELFTVETYETVHQMVSLVRGQMNEGTTLSQIFTALFPCGSITGAPKIRAMEIIHELEETPREIYCGSIGWAAPDGCSEFNVAIRTIMLEEGAARLNVGGGVIYDSGADSEYEEALWKARFAAQLCSQDDETQA